MCIRDRTCPAGRAVDPDAPSLRPAAAPARWLGGSLARSGSQVAEAAAAADRSGTGGRPAG
eukprot:14075682-Alexandrium_andersonii.AAC.1